VLLKSELMDFDETYAHLDRVKQDRCFNALDALCYHFDAFSPGSKGIGW
jgi:hypothetical protein